MNKMKVPEGWKVESMDSLTTLMTNGFVGSAVKHYRETGIPYLRSTNVRSNHLQVDDLIYISEEFHKESSRSQLQTGDLLTVQSGHIGTSAVVTEEFNGTNCHALIVSRFLKEKILSDFIAYYLNSDVGMDRLSGIFVGSTIKHINTKDLKKFDVIVPPLHEQQKIASILTSVDDVIKKTQTQINKLQDLKKGTMNELLTCGIGHTEFKDSPVGRIPKSWKVQTIGNSCEVLNTLRKPISRNERENMQGNYPYYGPTGILDYIDEYRLDGEYTLIGEDGDHFVKYLSKPQTLFVKGKLNVNNHAHIIQGTEECSTKWVYWYFLHRDITVSLTRQGAGRYKLNKESLLRLLFAIPSLSEQEEIASILSSIDKTIGEKQNKLEQTKNLKKSLMQDLLTGKVRVQGESKGTWL